MKHIVSYRLAYMHLPSIFFFTNNVLEKNKNSCDGIYHMSSTYYSNFKLYHQYSFSFNSTVYEYCTASYTFKYLLKLGILCEQFLVKTLAISTKIQNSTDKHPHFHVYIFWKIATLLDNPK